MQAHSLHQNWRASGAGILCPWQDHGEPDGPKSVSRHGESLAMKKQPLFVMILFALSLDLLVGYAGIVTLGHAGLFGMGGYTAGILSVHGITDPIVTALYGMIVAAVTGLVFGAAMLRTKGLTLLMLTMRIFL